MALHRPREGALLIDHRASPGISEADALRLRQLGHHVPVVPGGKVLELKTKSCAHCGTVVVINPDRIRARGRCNKCDKYLCDPCAAIGDCRPIQALADAVIGSDKPLSPFSPLLIRNT
jgi:hypothetical protein